MATLPLYTPADHCDGWQRVAAPGGYESWIFEIDGVDGRTRFVVGFHLGWPLDARYAQRYLLYHAMPTRVSPPIPADFPVVTIELLKGRRRKLAVACPFDTSDFHAESDRLDIRIGGSRARAIDDGSVQLTVRVQRGKLSVTAQLTFTPLLRASHRWAPHEHHHVLLCDPLCEAKGEVQVFETGKQSPIIVPVWGRGYREHRVGLRSLSDLRGDVIFARAIGEDAIACARIIDGHAGAIAVNFAGVTEREIARDELPLDEGAWRVERIRPRKLGWVAAGKWLGPRVGG
jgi:hypothetical protein